MRRCPPRAPQNSCWTLHPLPCLALIIALLALRLSHCDAVCAVEAQYFLRHRRLLRYGSVVTCDRLPALFNIRKRGESAGAARPYAQHTTACGW